MATVNVDPQISALEPVSTKREITVLPSASYSATQDLEFKAHAGNSLIVILDITTNGGSTVQVVIKGVDPASGKLYTILTGTAVVSTNSTTVYRVSPHLTAAAGSIVQDLVPKTVHITVTTTAAATFSVGAITI